MPSESLSNPEDLTRRLAEEQERSKHIRQVMEAIREVNRLIVKELDAHSLINDVCACLTPAMGYYNVWVVLLDEGGTCVGTGFSGIPDGFVEMERELQEGRIPECLSQALGAQGIVDVEDPAVTCGACPASTAHERAGLAHRLSFEGKDYGVILASVPASLADEVDSRELFSELARDLAFGLHHIEAQALIARSQRDLRRVQNLAGIGSYRINPLARNISFCDVSRRLVGLSRERLSLDEFRELIEPSFRDALFSSMDAMINEGQPFDLEFVIKGDVDGEARHLRSLAEYDVYRGVVVGSLQCVTQQRSAECALGESERYCQAILRTTPDGFWVVDASGKVVEVNEAYCRMSGYSRVEIIGKSIQNFDVAENPADTIVRMERVRMVGSEVFQTHHRKHDGSTLELEVRVQWMPERGGQYVCFFRDNSEGNQREQQLGHSRDLMRYIIEHANSAVAVHDRELRYVYVSQRYLEVFNVKDDAIVGKHHYDVFPDLPQKWRDVHQRVLNGEVLGSECDAYPKEDGTVEWTRWQCRPWFEANGVIGGLIVYTEIITDRVRAEEALRAQDELLKATIASSPVAIITLSEQGRVESWNPAAERMLGWSRDEVVGSCPMHVGVDREGEFREVLASVFAGNSINEYETKRLKKTGEEIDVRFSAAPLRDTDGNVVAMMAVLEDISERKQWESQQRFLMCEMEAGKAKAESANRVKDEFLAVMSHEMRTPLNAILGFANLLVEEPDLAESECRAFVRSIVEGGERMLRLVDNILQYVRLDRMDCDLVNSEFELMTLCRKVVTEMLPLAGNLKLEVRKGLEGHEAIPEHLEVVADSRMLQRLLDNLLNNACKYTDTGKVTLWVGMESGDLPIPKFRFIVEDTGIGIEQEQVKLLFKAFSQVDSSFTRDFDGAGLGLAICKKLADILNGTIEVESRPGEGSRFIVTLPLQCVEKGEEALADGGQTKKASLKGFGGSKRALVVDDREDNLLLSKVFLERLGVHCVIAHSGGQTLEICETEEFDVIFMDLCMPEMDGFETFMALRESGGPNASTPVVALTADAADESPVCCLEIGMAAHITKPVRIHEIGNILNEIFRV